MLCVHCQARTEYFHLIELTPNARCGSLLSLTYRLADCSLDRGVLREVLCLRARREPDSPAMPCSCTTWCQSPYQSDSLLLELCPASVRLLAVCRACKRGETRPHVLAGVPPDAALSLASMSDTSQLHVCPQMQCDAMPSSCLWGTTWTSDSEELYSGNIGRSQGSAPWVADLADPKSAICMRSPHVIAFEHYKGMTRLSTTQICHSCRQPCYC